VRGVEKNNTTKHSKSRTFKVLLFLFSKIKNIEYPILVRVINIDKKKVAIITPAFSTRI